MGIQNYNNSLLLISIQMKPDRGDLTQNDATERMSEKESQFRASVGAGKGLAAKDIYGSRRIQNLSPNVEPASAGIFNNGQGLGTSDFLDFDHLEQRQEAQTPAHPFTKSFSQDNNKKKTTQEKPLAKLATGNDTEQILQDKDKQFIQEFKCLDTLVDTVAIFGPDLQDAIQMAHCFTDDPTLILKEYEQKSGIKQLTPKLISAYPETNRGYLVINDATYKEMMSHSFGLKDYKCLEQPKKPDLKRVQSYQFGDKRRIYIEQLIFYEDLAQYSIANTEYELRLTKIKLEKEQEIEKKSLLKEKENLEREIELLKLENEELIQREEQIQKEKKEVLSRQSTQADSSITEQLSTTGDKRNQQIYKKNKSNFFQIEEPKRKRSSSLDSSRIRCNLFETLIEIDESSETDASIRKEEKEINLNPDDAIMKNQMNLNIIEEEQHSNDETSSKKSSSAKENPNASEQWNSHVSPALINSAVELNSQHRETEYHEITEQVVQQKDLDKTLLQSQMRTNTVPYFTENTTPRETMSKDRLDENIFGQSLLRHPDSIFKKNRQTDKQFNKMSILESNKRQHIYFKTQHEMLSKNQEVINDKLKFNQGKLSQLQKKLAELEKKEHQKKLENNNQDQRQKKENELKNKRKGLEQRKKSGKTVWVPRSVAIISRYPYYDYFNRILELLLDDMYDPEGQDRLTLEHNLFSIVFKIPCPLTDNNDVIFKNIRIAQPSVDDLPYANDSHFDLLLSLMDPEDIVRIFTSLLFEERVLLVMEEEELLLPITTALHSLIYPFELTIFIPYLANDGEDDEVNSIQQVGQPFGYFIGIKSKDADVAKEILKDDYIPDERPALILVEIKKDGLKFERKLCPHAKLLMGGVCKELPSSYTKNNSLPDFEEQQLIKEIKRLKKRDEKQEFHEKHQYRENYYYNDCLKVSNKDEKIYPRPISLPEKKFSHKTIQEVRKAFFSTIARLFLNYKDCIQFDKESQEDEFKLGVFLGKSNTSQTEKFYKRFFNDTVMVQNQIFSNFMSDVIFNQHNTIGEDQVFLKVQRLDAEIERMQEKKNNVGIGLVDNILSDIQIKQKLEDDPWDYAYKSEEKKNQKVVSNCQAWIEKSFLEDCFIQNTAAEISQKWVYPFKIEEFDLAGLNPQDEEESKDPQIQSTQSKNCYKVKYQLFPAVNKRFMAELQQQAINKRNENSDKYTELFNVKEDFGMDPAAQQERKNTFIKKRASQEVQQITIIQICWVLMFCSTLKEQDNREVWFRLGQLVQVLHQLQIEHQLSMDLFYVMINTTCKHAEFKCTKKLYELLVKFEYVADNRIKLRYFNHFKDDLKKQKDEQCNKTKQLVDTNSSKTQSKARIAKLSMNQEQLTDKEFLINKKEQQILNTNSKLYKRVSYEYKFKKRTFKTSKIMNIVQVEEVKLKLQEQCKGCTGQLLAPQLKKAIETAYKEIRNKQSKSNQTNQTWDESIPVKPKCTFCGKLIEKEVLLYYTIGKKVFRSTAETVDKGETKFWSAENLLQIIQDNHEKENTTPGGWQILLKDLREDEFKQPLFWNLLYYFNEYQLPFDCILPYENDDFLKEYDDYKNIQKKNLDYEHKTRSGMKASTNYDQSQNCSMLSQSISECRR